MKTDDALSGHSARTIDRHRPVCMLDGKGDDERRVPRRFIGEGFSRGDRAFHVVDARRRPDHLQRLENFGIDVPFGLRHGERVPSHELLRELPTAKPGG